MKRTFKIIGDDGQMKIEVLVSIKVRPGNLMTHEFQNVVQSLASRLMPEVANTRHFDCYLSELRIR